MPEGSRRTPVDITVPFEHYTEINVDGYTVYNFYIKGSDFLELPLDANVRLPSEDSIPYREMVATLEKTPQNFFLQNNGLTIIARGVDVKERPKKNVTFSFPAETGIVNGGHTQLAIINVKRQKDISSAFVKLEVIKHDFTALQLATIATSRNTASNVKPYSTAEKRGLFNLLKIQMTPHYEKHIIWYENREVPNNRGLLADDLIGLLNLFNIKLYASDYSGSQDQPTKTASGKNSVFKDWSLRPDEYAHVYPLVNDIISLYEHILATFYLKLPRGFTSLSVVVKNNQPKKSIFLNKDLVWTLPKQFLLPLMGAFRANVIYDETRSKIGWHEKPEALFDRIKKDLIDILMKTYRTTYHNEINRASKDPNLWQILFLHAHRQIKRGAKWKEYDIPK